MASSPQLEEEAAGKLETIHASAMAKSKKKQMLSIQQTCPF